MKPKLNIVRTNENSGHTGTVNQLPVTDYNYQAVTLDAYRGGCAKTLAPSFLNISKNYSKSEARRDFVSEASFFVAIVITAALPMMSNAHAIADFIRAVGV